MTTTIPSTAVTPSPAALAIAERIRGRRAELAKAAAEPGDGHPYVDDDNDGVCDICGAATEDHKGGKMAAEPETLADDGERTNHAFVDDDGDGKCDVCGMGPDDHEEMPTEEDAVDEETSTDGTKLAGGAKHDFVDENDDGKCDDCGMPEEMHAGAKAAADEVTLAKKDADEAHEQDPIQIDPANPGRFRAVLLREDERTADNRLITHGATSWRTPPLPLMLMTKTAGGHDGSVIAAVIETITRDGKDIVGEGRFDTGPDGVEAARLVANGVLKGVSIDGGDAEVEFIVESEDSDGVPTKVLQQMTALTILGATIVPFPAIGSTLIEWIPPEAGELAASAAELLGADCEECTEAEIIAITAAAPISFPKVAFDDPHFEGATPITVTKDGRVFGHAALFGQCHIGMGNVCVMAPNSKTGYAHFLTGTAHLVEGGTQPVGTLTMGGPHADKGLDKRSAERHYDDTTTAVAYVNVGEDAFGIWVAGVLKPDITDAQATELCGASLSGDWRAVGGNLELIAILAVNVPGFPIAQVKGDEQLSLVAAGYGPTAATRSVLAVQNESARLAEVERELALVRATLQRMQEQIAPIIIAQLATRFTPIVVTAATDEPDIEGATEPEVDAATTESA